MKLQLHKLTYSTFHKQFPSIFLTSCYSTQFVSIYHRPLFYSMDQHMKLFLASKRILDLQSPFLHKVVPLISLHILPSSCLSSSSLQLLDSLCKDISHYLLLKKILARFPTNADNLLVKLIDSSVNYCFTPPVLYLSIITHFTSFP